MIVVPRDGNVFSEFLRAVVRIAVERRAPRIGNCLFPHRIVSCVVAVSVLRHDGDVRPAPPWLDHAEGAGIGSYSSPAAVDHRGVRHDGHQRYALVLRHTSAVLSEYFLQDQNASDAVGWFER